MSTNRQWVYEVMTGSSALTALVPSTLILPGKAMHVVPKTKPFIVYREGNSSPDNVVPAARRQYFTVYIHDDADPGDYMKIDEIERLLIELFNNAPGDPALHIVGAKWLETSADGDDKEMETILRYVRFQVIKGALT